MNWQITHHGLLSYGTKGTYHILIKPDSACLTRKGLDGMINRVGTFQGVMAVLEAKRESIKWEQDNVHIG